MQFLPLADRPEAIPQVAHWYFEEWGRGVWGVSEEESCHQLREWIHAPGLPLHLLAIENDQVVGTAALKVREMNIYPEREFWLGNVYVDPAWRGNKLATRLVEEIVVQARAREITTLSLQTAREDGGLYAKLGWKPVERVHYHGGLVTLMERALV